MSDAGQGWATHMTVKVENLLYEIVLRRRQTLRRRTPSRLKRTSNRSAAKPFH